MAQWIIEGYDGLERIFGPITTAIAHERTVKRILQLLCARTLDPEEIIAAVKGRTCHLDISEDRRTGDLMTNGNPHFAARLTKEKREERIRIIGSFESIKSEEN